MPEPQTDSLTMTTRLYLTPADHGRAMSYDEFIHSAAQEGYRYELIEGKVVVSPIPNMPHEELLDWLVGKLDAYIHARPDIVNHLKAPARIFVPDAEEVTAPEPDIAVYRDFPLHLPLRERRWEDVSPVLVVEILSEDTAEKDTERNVGLYLRVHSVREYWILDPLADPDRPSLTVHRRRGQRWQRPIMVPAGGSYTTPLLPGFTLLLDPHV
jgi:Uma2 family endonuclease